MPEINLWWWFDYNQKIKCVDVILLFHIVLSIAMHQLTCVSSCILDVHYMCMPLVVLQKRKPQVKRKSSQFVRTIAEATIRASTSESLMFTWLLCSGCSIVYTKVEWLFLTHEPTWCMYVLLYTCIFFIIIY